jgi:uncharacterized spore protein YtfJ
MVGLLDRLLGRTGAEAIFGEPVISGDQMAITAAETKAGVWFGFGMGGGSAPKGQEEDGEKHGEGYGGGGGGGGMAAARPVAVITVRPGGVRIEPIIDVTKVGLALFTALGSMAIMWGRMMRKARH